MRTKALLCAAALAAGALSVVAQGNVYSLNVVGYVNVNVPAGYSLMANPLSAGATNGANEVMPLVDGSVILTYSAGAYTFRGYDTGAWIDSDGNPVNDVPVIPPGKGFFYYNPLPTRTMTFVGQVVPSPGVTNSFAIIPGYSLIGTPMPVSGSLGTPLPNPADPPVPGAVNMPIIDGEVILKYAAGAYIFTGYDTDHWIDSDGNPTANVPSINAGEGFFFYNGGGTAQWKQALP